MAVARICRRRVLLPEHSWSRSRVSSLRAFTDPKSHKRRNQSRDEKKGGGGLFLVDLVPKKGGEGFDELLVEVFRVCSNG